MFNRFKPKNKPLVEIDVDYTLFVILWKISTHTLSFSEAIGQIKALKEHM